MSFFWVHEVRAGGREEAAVHLAVPSGEDGPEDLPVLLHHFKLLLQGTLHMGISQHVFYYVFLQRPPQRSLIGAIKLKPEQLRQNEKRGEVLNINKILALLNL